MAQQFFVGSIISYDSRVGNYYIRLAGSNVDTEKGVPARLLNPIPYEDGGGLKSAPAAPRDSQCLVLKDGNRHYILGFLQPHGNIAYGDPKPVRPVGEAEMFLTHKTSSKFGFSTLGTIVLQTARWAQAAINPITNQLTAFFKNLRINLYSAIVEYFYDDSKDQGNFQIALTKYVDSPIPKPTGTFKINPPDRFILKAGALDDDHIIELNIEQDMAPKLPTLPRHASLTKLGKQKDGTYFSYKAQTGDAPGAPLTDALALTMTLDAKDDGKTKLEFFKTPQKKITALLDVKGSDAITFTINDPSTSGAEIVIKHDGNVTIKTSDNAKILVGGQGKEQRLVTQKFVKDIFEKHMHSNGNQGAPTGKPILPPIIDVNVDSNTGPFTFTTKAE